MWSLWFRTRHDCWCHTGWFEYFCSYWSLGFLQTVRVYSEWCEKQKHIQWVEVLWMEMPCWWGRPTENGQTGSSWQRLTVVTRVTTLYSCSEQKSISECTANQTLRRIGWTMAGSVSHEQKADAALGTSSPKLDCWRLEKRSLVWWIWGIHRGGMCTHLLMTTSSMLITKQTSAQTGFSSMQSSQRGTYSQRNIFNILWNPSHKELRLFFEQREGLPSISIVFLIKCSVSVHFIF